MNICKACSFHNVAHEIHLFPHSVIWKCALWEVPPGFYSWQGSCGAISCGAPPPLPHATPRMSDAWLAWPEGPCVDLESRMWVLASQVNTKLPHGTHKKLTYTFRHSFLPTHPVWAAPYRVPENKQYFLDLFRIIRYHWIMPSSTSPETRGSRSQALLRTSSARTGRMGLPSTTTGVPLRHMSVSWENLR